MKMREIDRGKNSIVLMPNHILDVLSFLDSTYQLHIFLLLIRNLKDFGQKEFNHYLAGQKALFEQEILTIQIPLSEISKPSEYRDVKKAFLDMSKIPCEIRYIEHKVDKIWSGSLFNVTVPVKANFSSMVKVNMDVVVARLFINFNRNHHQQPSFYSRIDTNIRLHTKLKNTIKLYLYLSLWKNKSIVKVSFVDLCNSLGLPKSYFSVSNFRKHILEPASQVLREFNDVWFDLDKIDIKKNKVGEHILEMKILTKEIVKLEEEKKNQITNFLMSHFDFKSNDLQDIGHIINGVAQAKLIDKLSYLLEQTAKMKNRANYVKIALINEFEK